MFTESLERFQAFNDIVFTVNFIQNSLSCYKVIFTYAERLKENSQRDVWYVIKLGAAVNFLIWNICRGVF